MSLFKKFTIAAAFSATLLAQAPGIASAATLPETRSSVIMLLSTRIDQLQVERDAALARYSDTSLSAAERSAARVEYRTICARQYKLKAQARRVRYLPLRHLVVLESYLASLVSPA